MNKETILKASDTELPISEPVLALARQMQFKLDKNKHKACPIMNPSNDGRGWEECSVFWLHGRILDEAKELEDALMLYNPRIPDKELLDDVLNECADVANFAMMIHDKLLSKSKAAAICEIEGKG